MKRIGGYVLAAVLGAAATYLFLPRAEADVGNLRADYDECIVRERTLQLQLDNLKAREDEYRRNGFARP